MLEASDKEPDIVVIVVSIKGGTESVTKYISGKTVEEVCSMLFGDGTVPAKKPRAKRRTKAEMQTKALGDTSRAEEEQKERSGEGEVPGTEPEQEARPRRKIFA